MAVANSDSMEVTTNRDVTDEQLAADLAVTDTPEAPAAEPKQTTQSPTESPAELPTTEDEPDPASDAGKKLAGKRKSMQQRIDELTWQKHQEASRREELERQLEAAKAPKAAADPKGLGDGEPDIETYINRIGSDFDNYERALAQWNKDTRQWERARDQQASADQERTRGRQQALHSVHTRGTDAHADFDAVLGGFVQQGGRFAPVNATEANGPLGDLEQVVLGHPLGHSVAYALAKDPALYQQILAAPSRVMFMADMGKLITRLEGVPSGSPSKPVPLSKAKPPIQPLGASPNASDVDPDEIPFGPHYVRQMNKRYGK